MPDVPEITTERLRLRPLHMDDWPAYRAMMASDRVRFMGGPWKDDQIWGWFCHDIALWQLYGHGALMIDRLADGVTVGQVGLNAGPKFPETELGWFLYDGFEGQGYITEAAAAFRDWIFENLPLDSFVSYVDEGNKASARVAERLGAVVDPDAERPDPEDIVYRHLRKD